MQELTKKQKAVFELIKSWYADKGYPPTIREIASHFGFHSTNSVYNYLKILQRKGYLICDGMKSRTWRPAKKHFTQNKSSIPMLGMIAAGSPLPVKENSSDTLRISNHFVEGSKNFFALQISGDSMIEAGILDGDYVIIDPHSGIKQGDIVAVLIGDEATVKYFFREKNYIKLEPANKSMAPIYIRIDGANQIETRIVGKVRGVYRKIE